MGGLPYPALFVPHFESEFLQFRLINVRLNVFVASSQFDFLHGVVVLALKLAIESDVLIDRQRLSPSVAGDQLKLGVGQCSVIQVEWRDTLNGYRDTTCEGSSWVRRRKRWRDC